MKLATESLVAALAEMKLLEEFTVGNLSEVGRYDFSIFPPEARDKITKLLGRLREDTDKHERLIAEILEKLQS